MPGSRRRLAVVALPLLVALLAGCTHRYVPNPHTFNIGTDLIPSVQAGGDVTLANVSDADGEVRVHKAGFHKYDGDLREWTDAAVTMAREALERAGKPVTDASNKELKLSVSNVRCQQSMWVGIRCTLTIDVETGSGVRVSVEGDNKSPAHLYRAIDGALMKGVSAMLNDPEILAYLND